MSDGKSIQCKKDPWMPSYFPSPLKLKPNHDPNIIQLAKLMHEERLEWNIAQLRKNLCDEEISRILEISISILRRENSWEWHFIRNRRYEVRSGYFIARKILYNFSWEAEAGPGPTNSTNLLKL